MTVRDTLVGAIEWTGARPLGDDPSAEEIAAALKHFQNMLLGLPSLGMAGQLTDIRTNADYPADETQDLIENVRLFNSSGSAITVTLPTRIYDPTNRDSDDNGYRAPRNGAVFKVAGSDPETHVWISYLGAWAQLEGLGLSDSQPLGAEFEEALQTMLAARICRPVFQRSPTPEVIAVAEMGRRLIRQRFRQTKPVTVDPVLTGSYRTATLAS